MVASLRTITEDFSKKKKHFEPFKNCNSVPITLFPLHCFYWFFFFFFFFPPGVQRYVVISLLALSAKKNVLVESKLVILQKCNHLITRISSYFEPLYFHKAFYALEYKTIAKTAGSEEFCLTTNIFSLKMHLFSLSQDTS